MSTDQLVATKKGKKLRPNEWVFISMSEYAFYQSLEKQFKDFWEAEKMRKEWEEARQHGKAYTSASDFMSDLLADE